MADIMNVSSVAFSKNRRLYFLIIMHVLFSVSGGGYSEASCFCGVVPISKSFEASCIWRKALGVRMS